MPIVIPPFVQYQAPLVPLRGLWNNAPPEGDKFVSAEIDWSVTTSGAAAVQFALSGNSPVAISQIVAMNVDNSRCAVDVQFIFPDSGYILVVPGYNEGIYPVFTNALMFYATAPGSALGDTTVFQVLNSMPPPVSIQPSLEQTHSSVTGINLDTNGTTTLVPSPVSGTIEAFSISILLGTGGAGIANVTITDGEVPPATLWGSQISGAANTMQTVNLSGLRLRFLNGLFLNISGSTITGTSLLDANIYYSLP